VSTPLQTIISLAAWPARWWPWSRCDVESNIFGAGFYILAYPNQATGAPLTQRIKIRNSTILSDWDGVYLDGGGYSFLGSTGVTDVSAHGTTLVGGQSPGTASQLVLFSGQPQTNSYLEIQYTPPVGPTVTATAKATAPEQLNTLVGALASNINASSSLHAGSVTLANSFYGMLFVSTVSAPSAGITNGNITVSAFGSGGYPISVVQPGTSGSYTGSMMAGNGIYLTNNPHSIDVISDSIYSTLGAGLYIGYATNVNAFANTISNGSGTGNTYGIYFGPSATPPSVFAQTNNLTGNTGAIAGATPSPTSTPSLLRGNRGYNPTGVLTPPFPTTSGVTVYSAYDCFVNVSGLPTGATIFVVGTTAVGGAATTEYLLWRKWLLSPG